MRLTKIFAIGLVVLTAVAVSTPDVAARNPARFSNVPFVVPGFCAGATSKWVVNNGSLAIQITNPYQTDNVGFQIFNSSPTSNIGMPSTSTGAVPSGPYSFTVSGLPSSGALVSVFAVSTTSGGSFEYLINAVTEYNGTISFTVPPNMASVAGYFKGNTPNYSTIYLTNFRQNNMPILSDTTQSATSTTNAFYGYCTF